MAETETNRSTSGRVNWIIVALAAVIALLILSVGLMLNGGVKTKPAEAAVTAEPEGTEETAEPVSEPEVYTAEFFFTGDALIHGTVWMDAARGDGTYDFSGILENIGKLAEGYDLKYYNQETILGGTELGLSGYPTFNSPQEVGDAMVNMGFNLVSTANTHSHKCGNNKAYN